MFQERLFDARIHLAVQAALEHTDAGQSGGVPLDVMDTMRNERDEAIRQVCATVTVALLEPAIPSSSLCRRCTIANPSLRHRRSEGMQRTRRS